MAKNCTMNKRKTSTLKKAKIKKTEDILVDKKRLTKAVKMV